MTLSAFGTLFSGGEGAGIGLQAAGLRHMWGVEYDPAIAAVAQHNGFAVRVADVRAVDYTTLPAVDWLHASPVCTRASNANPNATESPEDIDTAAAVVRALDAIRPQVFTLENVWGYRDFTAFKTICKALGDHGYFWDFEHVNAADMGVPQTRKRLILRASRGLLPHLPAPVPWVGWYEAIEDLIPTLPESKLAPWQLARLPQELRETVLVGGGNTQLAQVDSKSRAWHEPMFTVTGNTKMGDNRAVLVSNAKTEYGDGMAQGTEPAWSVTSQTVGRSRAVLVDRINASGDRLSTLRQADEPSFALTVYSPKHQAPQALLFPRVVSMTPRCLARFQSVPDDYRLPTKRTLAAKVIGNMVPPLLMQRIAENMMEANQ